MTTPCRAISPHPPSIARVLFSRSWAVGWSFGPDCAGQTCMSFVKFSCSRHYPSAGWGDFGSSPMYPTGVGGWEDKSKMAEPPPNALTPLSITNKFVLRQLHSCRAISPHPPSLCLLAGCWLLPCVLAAWLAVLHSYLAGWLARWLADCPLLACLPACVLACLLACLTLQNLILKKNWENWGETKKGKKYRSHVEMCCRCCCHSARYNFRCWRTTQQTLAIRNPKPKKQN